MQKAIIVDLDDCLFDSRPLNKYFPTDEYSREQWNVFQSKINECKLNKHIQDLVLKFADTHKILFVTSREAINKHIEQTKQMIDEVCIKYFSSGDIGCYRVINYELFMRNEEDYRPSTEVKRDIYTMCIKDRYIVDFAIDDCPKNIEMFKSLGINTLQCAYGESK